MKKILSFSGLLFALMLSLFSFSSSLQAQDSVPAGSKLTVDQTIPISATVEVNINGKLYKIDLPATVHISVQSLIAAVAEQKDIVGDVSIVITDISDQKGKYTYNDYHKAEVSNPESNKLEIVSIDVKNISKDPVDLRYGTITGFDSAGKTYESSNVFCDSVNPGETKSCAVVFDVVKDVNIAGISVKVTYTRDLTFQKKK